MAKCAVCLSKKGKRKCARKDDAEICSLCCGQTRTAEECEGCSFYQAPKRDYITIPYYTPEEMDGVLEREDISEVIESEICTLDSEHEFTLSDEHARRIIELILDEYYFNVSDLHKDSDPIINEGYERLSKKIKMQLADVSKEELIKIIAAIYFVIRRWQRRGGSSRNYLEIIKRFVGIDTPEGYLRVFNKADFYQE